MDADPRLLVAVLMERQRQPNAWEAWRFRIHDVVVDEGQFGDAPRTLRDDGLRWVRAGVTSLDEVLRVTRT